MTDVSFGRQTNATLPDTGLGMVHIMRVAISALLALGAVVVCLSLAGQFHASAGDDPLLKASTLGELVIWMADQSGSDAPESLLGQLAKSEAARRGDEALDSAMLLVTVRDLLADGTILIASAAAVGLLCLFLSASWSRVLLLLALFGVNSFLFVVPVLPGDSTTMLIMLGSFLLAAALVISPGGVDRVVSFVVLLTVLLLLWETAKAAALSVDYNLTIPVTDWQYDTYDSLDAALSALADGEIEVVIADRNDVRDLVAPSPDDDSITPETLPYPGLRSLAALDSDQSVLGIFPVSPAFPGRLSAVVQVGKAALIQHVDDLHSMRMGAVAGDFADARYLALEQNLVLVDLKIFNDINLPHLQNIAEALLQPARRNGPLLLVRILTAAALHTWGEAGLGFVFGATLGFLLGTIFAHFAPAERGLLPFVVASQTIPILAIAPMVVIWLGAGPASVAVISAYLTFFPVTINTLRGLRSPQPSALELMHSYAASRWEIMWKLRFPAALPYIFTALKVSATASVVGAIIGELPSSIRDGLGRAILDFSSDYSLISTPKLWAAILIASFIGITSFLIVGAVERVVLRGYVQEV